MHKGLLLIITLLNLTILCSCSSKQSINPINQNIIKEDSLNLKSELTKEETNTNMKMNLEINGNTYTVSLANNSSVDALLKLMEDKPLTLNMRDYAGMEKNADLPYSIIENNSYMDTHPGDIILYQGKTLVIYYETNSWSLTPIGKIDNITSDQLKQVLGSGDVSVTFSLH